MKISHRQMVVLKFTEPLIEIGNKLRKRIDKNPWPKNRRSHSLYGAICDELQWRRQSKSE